MGSLAQLSQKLAQCHYDLGKARKACDVAYRMIDKTKKTKTVKETFPHRVKYRKHMKEIHEALQTVPDIRELPTSDEERKQLFKLHESLGDYREDAEHKRGFIDQMILEDSSPEKVVQNMKRSVMQLAESVQQLLPHWAIRVMVEPTSVDKLDQATFDLRSPKRDLLSHSEMSGFSSHRKTAHRDEKETSIVEAVSSGQTLVFLTIADGKDESQQSANLPSSIEVRLQPSITVNHGEVDLTFSSDLTVCCPAYNPPLLCAHIPRDHNEEQPIKAFFHSGQVRQFRKLHPREFERFVNFCQRGSKTLTYAEMNLEYEESSGSASGATEDHAVVKETSALNDAARILDSLVDACSDLWSDAPSAEEQSIQQS